MAGQRLRSTAFHALGGAVGVAGDWPMASMPIWGNECTVSFEPYCEPSVGGAAETWQLTYNFTAVSAALAGDAAAL